MREVVFSVFCISLCTPVSTGSAGTQTVSSSSQHMTPDREEGPSIPEELTLERALEILRERSPMLYSERQRVDAARGDLQQARKLPNPAFSLETEEFGSLNGPSEARSIFLGVEQQILTAGKRKKRSLVAESLLGAARNEVRAFEWRLSYLTKVAHAALVMAQSNLDLVTETLAEFDRIISLNRMRYERGEISGGELRRVEAERLSFLEGQVAAEVELESARAELLGLLGLPDYTRPFQAVAPPRMEQELARVETLVAEALRTRPEIMAQLERKEAARRQVAYAKALAVPNLVPFVNYQTTQEPTIPGQPRATFLNFGVSMSLPLFNRNQGGVARALAESRREDEFERAIRYQVTVEVRKAWQAFVSEQKRVRFFEETYLHISREARDIAEAAYRMGGETLINFLDASRVYRETLQAYHRALYDLRVARYQVELALGKELS